MLAALSYTHLGIHMKSRDEWMNELVRRQDNIDPIRRIPNNAFFQGTLIKGSLRLNKFQRFAAGLLGFIGLIFGCFLLAQVVKAVRAGDFSSPDLPSAILCPLSLWFSLRILRNALLNDPKATRQSRGSKLTRS